jgi:hypothetical protein
MSPVGGILDQDTKTMAIRVARFKANIPRTGTSPCHVPVSLQSYRSQNKKTAKPRSENKRAMIDQQIEIPTKDGHTTTFISHPERDGPHPVIIFYMDAPAIARNCATWRAGWRPRAIT